MNFATRIMLGRNAMAGWTPSPFRPGKWMAHVLGNLWTYWHGSWS